ncbi:tripartite motif-containing protein 35 [Kryptolebias marmoratus]|uniref:Tripartite motif-containing protein 35-like n=1 Tax=Kryptolebias marmoratus TaxID=37003 RepID=A0A3Q3A7N6_KRYMA|nr:tripartite motif-containing protein 35 [Kryptolebias marmoratus]
MFSAQPEHFCTQHAEKLKLFCEDHLYPVCVICRDSKAHSEHRFKPVDEAAKDYSQQVEDFLMPLQEKLKSFKKVRENYSQTAKHITVQTQHAEKQIKEQFKKLHQFLQKEEEARIAALKREEKQRTQMMAEKIKSLESEIASISETIQDTGKTLRAGDVPFLQNYEITIEKIQLSLLLDDPQLIPGALIDLTQHLGNLSFSVWSKMKEVVSFSPVVLDPNTAHPDLALSDDLTSVRRDKKQELPANPERILSYPSVLGSEGFDSKTHSWDVEVGDNQAWAVGVSAASIFSSADKTAPLFKLSFCDGKYTADSGHGATAVLSVKTKLRSVRVHLDCDRKRVTFSDPETNANIHTFTHSLQQKLFPYFNVVKQQPLKVTPEKVSVEPDLDKH